MTVNVAEVKRRLHVFLNDTNLVNEYIRQYGPSLDMKNIKAIKELKYDALQSEDTPSVGTDPVYTLEVKCPVCNKDSITRFELRAKSQQIMHNKFLVPLYNGAPPYRTVDYTMLGVTVCPRCLFASPDKKDFIYQGITGQNEKKTQLGGNVLMTLQEKIGERKAIIKPGCDTVKYFGRNRTREAAIDSYKLAIVRAKVEAWYEQPYAYYKIAAGHLRIAKILKDANVDNIDSLKEALNFCEEAFRTSNCPSEEIEMQVVYTIVALYLKLNDQKKANSYIGVFNNISNSRQAEMKTNPKLTCSIIEKWAERAKYLWDDRDMEDLFDKE